MVETWFSLAERRPPAAAPTVPYATPPARSLGVMSDEMTAGALGPTDHAAYAQWVLTYLHNAHATMALLEHNRQQH